MLNLKEAELVASLMHSSAVDELMECLTDRSDRDDSERSVHSAPQPLEPYRSNTRWGSNTRNGTIKTFKPAA